MIDESKNPTPYSPSSGYAYFNTHDTAKAYADMIFSKHPPYPYGTTVQIKEAPTGLYEVYFWIGSAD